MNCTSNTIVDREASNSRVWLLMGRSIPVWMHLLLVLAIWPSAGAIGGVIDSLGFYQIDFEQGADSVANSDWGSVDLGFTGTSGFQYFNLVINGVWQVQNMPIAAVDGVGVSQSQSLNFNLGNSVGSQVTSVNYLASLDSTPLITAPLGTASSVAVTTRNVTVGGLGGPLGFIPSAVSLVGSLPVSWAFNFGVPNQDCGVDECAPAAFSNSLKWLAPGIPDQVTSIDGLKGPTSWVAPQIDTNGAPIPGTGGVPVNGWKGKGTALEPYGITTRFFTPDKIGQVLAEIDDGQDVEIWGDHHAAVVVGLVESLDGTYTIVVKHDTDQGTDGGTKTELITYDPDTGLLTGGSPGFFDGAGIRGFVVECPEPSGLALLAVGVALFLARRKAA
jgi:hypothetical protein